MSHTQALVLNIELGVLAGIALVRWLVGLTRRG
jgi:hypothetical protein